jgi:hypothetical protein
LRLLGKKTRGRLRSGVLDGRNCWWWDPPPAAALEVPDGAPDGAPDGGRGGVS